MSSERIRFLNASAEGPLRESVDRAGGPCSFAWLHTLSSFSIVVRQWRSICTRPILSLLTQSRSSFIGCMRMCLPVVCETIHACACIFLRRCGKREEGGDHGGVSATGAGAGRGKCGLKHLVWCMLHEGGCDLKHLRVLRV